MSNPFQYYNKEYRSYERKSNKKIPQIIMKYRLVTFNHCETCLKLNPNFRIIISNIYNTPLLQIPEKFIDDECDIKNEYRFITNKGITPENLPEWFSTWTDNFQSLCHDGAYYQETYIPISFTLKLYNGYLYV